MGFSYSHAFGVTIAAAAVAVSTVLAVATGQTARETYVPGAAHVSGANNTTWRTDLELRSVGTIGARVQIDLLRKNRDNTNPPSTILDLPAGHARRVVDVLDELFGYVGSATLRITALDGEVRATSRTFNTTPDGTFGQYIGGTDQNDVFATGNDATLIQLTSSASNSSGFRTNLGLVNLEGFPIDVDIDLYLADLQFLGRVTVRLEAFEFDQVAGVFSQVTLDEVPDGIAIVRAVTGSARYLTYASVIDNLTGDPIYIPGVANTAAVRTNTPTRTPTQTPTGDPSFTPTPTPTPPGPAEGVTVTTVDDETFHLVPSSILFRVGGGTQSSLVLCSFDGTLSQVNSSSFRYISGPTETVEWMNCCSSTNYGARLEYETVFGAGGPAVARSTCTAGTPLFAITGTEIGTGLTIEINGENLDLAEWP